MYNADNLSVQIGKRIYERRKQLGITQEELADIADTTPQAISNYERGERELKASTIIKIASALNISSDFLLSGKNPSSSAQLKNLPDAQKQIICDIIDECIKLAEKAN